MGYLENKCINFRKTKSIYAEDKFIRFILGAEGDHGTGDQSYVLEVKKKRSHNSLYFHCE
jgi:hypothetical protein